MARKTKQAINLSANEVFGETNDLEQIDGEYHDDLDENGNVIPLDVEPIVEAVKPIKARGIGKFIVEQIMSTTDTNQQILDSVLANFEGAKTTMACIAWYKTKLRKEGKIAAKVKLATPVETTEEALV